MITALGQKSINLDWNERPEDFIAFYLTQLCEVEDLKSVASRYEFFEEAFEEINISLKSKLYYGIKSGLIFEYGILSEGQKTALGEFKITKSIFRDLSGLSSPSSVNLKIFLLPIHKIILHINTITMKKNLLQLIKVKSFITVTELGMVRDPSNPEQFSKALLPMLVTELGIERDPVNPVQKLKASFPMLVTKLGMVRDPVNPLHALKALFPIDKILEGKSKAR